VSGFLGHILKKIIMRSYRYMLHIQCAKGIKKMAKFKSRCGI